MLCSVVLSCLHSSSIVLWFVVHLWMSFHPIILCLAVWCIITWLFAVLCCAVLCCLVLCASVRHFSSPHWLWNLISSLLLSVTLPFPQQRREVHPLDPSLGKHNPVPVIFPKQRSLPYIRKGGVENMQHAKPNGWKKNILCWNFCGLRLKAETKCFAQLRFIPLHSLSLSLPLPPSFLSDQLISEMTDSFQYPARLATEWHKSASVRCLVTHRQTFQFI